MAQQLMRETAVQLPTPAFINLPELSFDAFHNLYIADDDHNRIRKVDTNGIITTVAGNGIVTYAGDGGTATNASLSFDDFSEFEFIGLAFDAAGNLYFSDTLNNRIREVNIPGIPTLTVSNIGVINVGSYSVVITSSYGSVTSSIASLTVAAPPVITVQPASQLTGLGGNPVFSVAAIGSGPFGYNWYLAGTNLVQTGTNNTLSLPNVATNSAGKYTVVITNSFGSVTSRVATLTFTMPPTITTPPVSQTNLAGTTVSFSVAVSNAGPFTYQWRFNGTNFPNNVITAVAGKTGVSYSGDGGLATNATISRPYDAACDSAGNVYIADTSNNRIRKVDTNRIITTIAGKSGGGYSGDGGAATNANLNNPRGVIFDAFGNLYIADTGNNRIRKVDTNDIIITVAGMITSGFSGDGNAATNAALKNPADIALDSFGNLFIADNGNNRIRKVDTNGIITTVAGNGTAAYAGDGGAATNASLYSPSGVALDSQGNLYIADYNNNRIREVDANGIITTVAGNGTATYAGDGGAATNASLHEPERMVLDVAGNFYIADYYNNCIRKVDINGIIATVAGNGNPTSSGDGGAATNAGFNPIGVALDSAGDLYIVDYLNSRIREVNFAGYPTLVLTNVSVTNAGNYSVVITGSYGSVTSVVASLTVNLPPPQIITSGTNFGFTTNQSGFGFKVSGTVGQTIVVDGSTNLVNWIPLFTNTAGTNPAYFFDPISTNFPSRYYRARLP